MQALISPHTHAKQLHLAISDYMYPLPLLVNDGFINVKTMAAWAVWPARLDHGRYINYSPHQNRVHVLHLSLSLPLLTSEMPLLLWMDCLHW